MDTIIQLETALRQALPDADHGTLVTLAKLVASVIGDTLLDAPAQREITADPATAKLLRQRLASQAEPRRLLFTLGQDNQYRDVAIGDVAGGNVIKITINAAPPPATDPCRFSVSRLPPAGRHLFGREDELQQLDSAWDDPKTNIVQVVAWGGVGKSSLVGHWIIRMQKAGMRGALRAFAWSFYSQGTTDRVASADLFIESALEWFGDPTPGEGVPWSKGERLARLSKSHRTLLILDGLEPLQHPPGEMEGRLKDQAIEALVRELAHENPGLCVLTTRLPLSDLEGHEGKTVRRINLEQLSPEDGGRLLGALGVYGDEAELTAASADFGGHCLAVTLLGSYLKDAYDGDVRRLHEIGPLQDDERHGGHARRVLSAYERWLGEGPEVALLRLLGLFDRPADAEAVVALRGASPIPGLTDRLHILSDPDWRRVVSKLRRAMLLVERDQHQPEALDTHPLIREYFGQQLRQTSPDAWREGNRVLYELLATTPGRLPITLQQLAPQYSAVTHGCEAGCHNEALDLYRERIQRGEERFSFHRFGAFGADLVVLSNFFSRPWSQLRSGLAAADRLFILAQVGRCLRALGRMVESADAFHQSMQIALSSEDWKSAASRAGNLSHVHLVMGELEQAVNVARQGVELADRSGDLEQRMSRRTNLAEALHQTGSLQEAQAGFVEAERLQKEWQPERPLLRSIEGFRYCDFLLTLGYNQEVEDRATRLLEWDASDSLLALGLHHLALGSACLCQSRLLPASDFGLAQRHLGKAMDHLRRASTQHHLPRGLLARAELYREMGRVGQAEKDIEEALCIALRGGMTLFEADCQLACARLQSIRGDGQRATEILACARDIIQKTGYGRRSDVVKMLERMQS